MTARINKINKYQYHYVIVLSKCPASSQVLYRYNLIIFTQPHQCRPDPHFSVRLNNLPKFPQFPNGKKWKSLSRVQLFGTSWTVVHGILQARIPEWVAYPFSSGPSQLRSWTGVSCITRGFFTNWAKWQSWNSNHSDMKAKLTVWACK